jgi:hypothetical protein
MTKNNRFFAGILAITLVFGMVVLGCDTKDDGGGNNSGINSGNGSGGNGSGGNGSGGNNNSEDENGGNGSGGNNNSEDENGGNGSGGNGSGGNGSGGNGSGTTTVPSAPTNVKATAQSSTSIRITWNAVSGATSYKIYSPQYPNSFSNFVLLDTVTTTSYTDTDPYPGETWYYKVSAVNSAGESALSSYTSATTPSSGTGSGGSGGSGSGGSGSGGNETVSKPNAPYGIIIKSSATTSNSLTIEWDAALGATSYKLYRSESASGSFTQVYSGPNTTYKNTGLKSGTTYYYKATAVNSAGESAYTSVAQGTTK